MADQNKNQSSKALIKRGVGKIASKFGHSSHATAGSGSLGPAISTTLSGALSMTPAFSVAHKEDYYPFPDPSQAAQDADATRYRGRVDLRTSGNQNPAQHNRLPGAEGNKKDDDKNQKKDDDKKKKGENSKKAGKK